MSDTLNSGNTEVVPMGTVKLKALMASPTEVLPPRPAGIADLTNQIRVEHEAVVSSFKSGLHHAVRCGELLIAAKRIVGHGGWLPWFRANQWISSRTASDYMRLAAHRATVEAKSADSADLTIQSALKLLSPNKPPSNTTTKASPAPPAPASGSEKRFNALSAAWHEAELVERAKFQAEVAALEAATPDVIAAEPTEPQIGTSDADILAAAGVDAKSAAAGVAAEVMEFLARDLSDYAFNHVAACLQHEEVWCALRELLAQRLGAKRS